MKQKVLVAMSGGVDSSACALVLKRDGYDPIGVTMHLHSESDSNDAKSVCERIGIPHQTAECKDLFENNVIYPFIDVYESGKTPNPCIQCNRTMKFGHLFRIADELSCEKLATGHYARVEYDEASNRYLLKKAKCLAKDQSYVLYFLSQEQLSRILFPLGEFESKDEVRALAAGYALRNAGKTDSQDICFIPDGDYMGFITRTTGKSYPTGDFIDITGKKLGEHKGLPSYTVGQRKGLGIALGEPMYVKCKCAASNTVTLARNDELFTEECTVENVNYIAFAPPGKPIRAGIKVRYSAREVMATIYPIAEDGTVKIVFDSPVRAITAGQAAVFYDGDTVLGGGTIV